MSAGIKVGLGIVGLILLAVITAALTGGVGVGGSVGSELYMPGAADGASEWSGDNYDYSDRLAGESGSESALPAPIATRSIDQDGAPDDTENPEEVMPRRIIRDATLGLRVQNYEGAKQAIDNIVEQAEGYYGNVNVTHYNGEPSSANMTLRIPSDQLDRAVSRLRQLGEVQQERVTSRDITSQFYDSESRLRSKRALETRLLAMLAESERMQSTAANLIAINRELEKVINEIEGLEGQLRLWRNQVAFSTVTLSLDVADPYEGSDVEVEEYDPSLGERTDDAWNSSISSLGNAGEDIVVFGAGSVPWLLLLAGLGILGLGGRFVWRAVRGSRPSDETPATNP